MKQKKYREGKKKKALYSRLTPDAQDTNQLGNSKRTYAHNLRQKKKNKKIEENNTCSFLPSKGQTEEKKEKEEKRGKRDVGYQKKGKKGKKENKYPGKTVEDQTKSRRITAYKERKAKGKNLIKGREYNYNME